MDIDDESKGRFVQVTEDNLIELLTRHTGPEDVPAFSDDNFDGFVLNVKDILEYLRSGQDVYQFIIEWIPDWLAQLRGEHLPEPPDGWLSIDEVHAIKRISLRTIKEYCGEKGTLSAQKCKGGIWYVEPDIAFDYWITKIPGYGALYQRLLIAKELLRGKDYDSVRDLYDDIELQEPTDLKRGMYDKYHVYKFMPRALEEMEPSTVAEYRERIDELIDFAKQRRADEYSP